MAGKEPGQMPPTDQKESQPEGRGERLRIDPSKVDVARLRLSAVDRAVFPAEKKHRAEDHERLLREAVIGLFGHG
jgi:hypothetical protein